MKVRCAHDKMVSVKGLKPHPKNRNKHPEDQVERLARILEYQGWRYPIKVSNLSGFVTSGHGRMLAAKHLGWDKVPVNYQDYESEEQEYADVQADNAIASWSELDLASINKDLGSLGPDFDLDLLGIKDFTLDMADKEGECDEDEVPEAQKEAYVRPGDLFILGSHRLLCGDSTDVQAVSKLMNGEKADMVFTDPPYNHASDDDLVAASVSKSMKALKNSNWDKNFSFTDCLPVLDSFTAKDCSIYICTSWHLAGQIWEFYATRSSHSSYCVWHKPNPMPSLMKRHWTWSSELICYATKGKHTFNFPAEGHASNVWSVTKKSDGSHPTMKPVELIQIPLERSSNKGHLIMDLFLGSGSTLIACEKTNRKCFGLEIDPLYCGVILDRWAKFTGLGPHREDGTPWSTIKANGTT